MATGDTYPDLGITFKIASGKPASEDQTGYGALTWVDVAGVVSLPERGDEVADISEPTLADGRNEHLGGLKDGGVLQIPVKFVEGDAGQAAIVAAVGGNATFSFQEVDPDGEAHFSYGRIMSYRRRQADNNTFKGHVLTIGVNSARFTGTEES